MQLTAHPFTMAHVRNRAWIWLVPVMLTLGGCQHLFDDAEPRRQAGAASGPPVSLRCRWYVVEGHLRINYQVANARRWPIFAGDQIALRYTFHELDAMGKEIGTEWGGNSVHGGPGPVRYDLLKGTDRAEWTDAVRGSATSRLDMLKHGIDLSKSYVECTAHVWVRAGASGESEEVNLTCTARGVGTAS